MALPGIYVYVVYIPTADEGIATVGAYDSFNDAASWTRGDHEQGNAPYSPDKKRFRIAQVPRVPVR